MLKTTSGINTRNNDLESARRDDRLWVHRRAVPVRFRDRLILVALVTAGVVAVLRLFDWWFRAHHVQEPALFILLSVAFWYGVSRILVGWFNSIGIMEPELKSAPEGLRVAIFTTSSPGEPLSMFETTLAACARITYPHTTYLLDDTQDPRFKNIAEKHGAVWLELVGLPGAKAGKVNRALELTDEEFILILDPDHIPFPNFLDRVLGYFDEKKVGFVQVCQAYYNQARSFVARGAAEQTYAFYGPMMMGMFGHGTSLAIGANCTFRRSALASIGGHGIGLAEDLVTTIRLHAAGWKSVYVPEIVSRGLVPEDLGSFFKQQLKWARGVYELLFAELPRLVGKLTWRQRISYSVIGTYYLCGVTTPIYIIIPFLYLWFGLQPAAMRFEGFLTSILPVAMLGTSVYLFTQRWLCHPELEWGTHWRGLALKVGSWPVYALGTILAVMNKPIPYIPTSKEAQRGQFLRLAAPHVILLILYLATVFWVVWSRLTILPEAERLLSSEAVWGMVAFETLSMLMIGGAIYSAWESTRLRPGVAWDEVDLEGAPWR
jgi:cellulose synthase (UDP-forming)